MSETKLPYGKPVKLLIDLQGFPDGRLVLFEIWRKKGGNEEKITEVYGVTKGGKGVGRWIPLIERKEVLPLQEKITEPVEEEKYYFIAKIDDQETKSGDMLFTYPLDISLQDTASNPVDGVKYKVTFSDGSEKKGEFKKGHATFENAPTGKFKIELEDQKFVPPMITDACWEKDRAKFGDKVMMVVGAIGFDDDTPAKFKIWEKDANGTESILEEIEGKVQRNKVETVWVYSPEEVEEELKEEVEEVKGEPEYFFAVEIEGVEAKSGMLVFTYPLDIYLEDQDGNPLDNVEYSIALSDGTEKTGKFKEGHAKIEDVPYGNFVMKIGGYDFVFD
jgi:hypothetical protein